MCSACVRACVWRACVLRASFPEDIYPEHTAFFILVLAMEHELLQSISTVL